MYIWMLCYQGDIFLSLIIFKILNKIDILFIFILIVYYVKKLMYDLYNNYMNYYIFMNYNINYF